VPDPVEEKRKEKTGKQLRNKDLEKISLSLQRKYL
jgi:hypothetical protein